jgi:hypothetical protein
LAAVLPSFAQVDTISKTAYDFKNIRIHKSHGKVMLEDTSGNRTPLNICPQLPIDKLCSISKEISGAIVRSGKNYYVINRYAEISTGFGREPIAFISHNNSIFTYKTKRSKTACLYDMNGNELGQISKYVYAELVKNNDKDAETYIRIYDKNDKQGLVNSKGELMMECIYDHISAITDGVCTIAINGREGKAYLDKLKPHAWK